MKFALLRNRDMAEVGAIEVDGADMRAIRQVFLSGWFDAMKDDLPV